MQISTNANKIILTDAEYFDIGHILECGQVFRFKKLRDKEYIVYSLDKSAHIYTQEGVTGTGLLTKQCRPVREGITTPRPHDKASRVKDDRVVVIDCGKKEDVPYFYNYFDLETDYGDIQRRLLEIAGDNAEERAYLKKALEFGKGIRILRQDKVETIISFIISANNNIKRIQGIIERLCAAAGRQITNYYAFPELQALAKLDKKFYNEIGAGYRDGYLAETAQILAGGFDISAVEKADTGTAEKLISRLKGVGPKVANCILLFGFAKFDTFPVDTWIAKVFNSFYGSGVDRREMRRRLVERYGSLAGYAQQYLFYMAREKN